MSDFSKNILGKIKDKTFDKIVEITVGSLILLLIGLASFLPPLKNWLSNKHQLELYGYIWIISCLALILFAFVSLCTLICHIKNRSEYLTNKNDIIMRIEDWFKPDEYGNKIEAGYQDSYRSLEKDLNIKKGYLKLYLPNCALSNKLFMQYGKQRFTLKKLTSSREQELIEILKKLTLKQAEIKEKGFNEAKPHVYELEDKWGWPRNSIYPTLNLMFSKNKRKNNL